MSPPTATPTRHALGFEAEDLETLVHFEMPFGRYRGRALIDLPEEYLLWFERIGFPTGELGRLLQLTLGIKRFGAEEVVKDLRHRGLIRPPATGSDFEP